MLNAILTRLRERFHNLIQSEIIRRLVKNSGYLFSTTGISAGLSMVQGILVVRLLGVANYGILGAIITFTSVVNKFASFRMSELVIKYIGQFSEIGDNRRAAAVFKAAALTEMLASLIAYGLIWILAPLGARYLAKDITLANWFSLYGLIVLANLISESSTGLLQIFDRFRRMAALSVIQSVVTLAIVTVAFLTNGGLLQILLAYLAGKIVGALGLTIAAVLEANRRWGNDWWQAPISLLRPQVRELANFAISTNISASLSLVNKDSELLWISFFRGPVETGFYRLALTLANLVQMPISPLPQATYPELSREVARKNWGNVRYVLRQGSLMAGGYTLAATLVLLVFGQPIIRILYTPEFLPAYPALLILLAGFLVANTFYWNRTALLALGRPDFPTKINLGLAFLKLIGMFLLVPRFGYLASASLLAGSYILGVSISALKVRSLVSYSQQAESQI
jgi:O-antigen/teichoic acid export membrane protein